MNQSRKLTATCLEGSMLLRKLDSHTIHKASSSELSSSTFDEVPGSKKALNSLEVKLQIIRQAHKFLQKDTAKFLNPLYNKQDRLLRFSSDVADITSKLIQSCCDMSLREAVQPKSPSLKSLKICDYRNNKGTQTKRVHVALTGTQTGELDLLASNAFSTGAPSSIPPAPVQASRDVLREIDCLGGSLDSKISTFCSILVQLKEASQKGDAKRAITGLVGTISKTIHELTEDTRLLGDIKGRLEPSDLVTCGGRESQTQSMASKYDEQPRQRSSNMRGGPSKQSRYESRPESTLSYELPLQKALGNKT
jgi:hypothetical protein